MSSLVFPLEHLIYLHLMELMIYVDLNISFHLLSIWPEYFMLHFSLLATFESIQAFFYYSIPPLSHQLYIYSVYLAITLKITASILDLSKCKGT